MCQEDQGCVKSRWKLPVNCKKQSQGGDGLLSSRQVVHGSEPLSWSHTVVVDSIQIGLLRIFWAQESLPEADVQRFHLIKIKFNTIQKVLKNRTNTWALLLRERAL